MARRRRFSSNTVRTVGALLPSDVLAKALEGDGLEGLDEESYGLDADVRMRDAVNDAWNEARSLWWRFVSELRELPEDDATATALTRERWLIPLLELLGFDDIDLLSSSISIGKADYPISHMWSAAPLHLMGARLELDTRMSGIPGAARLSPHSLTRQFLNRSDDHLWGIVSNGHRLRILRDAVSLTRQAFVEFDLEAMFNGEVFVDFVLLYRVAHATRFDGERPEDCLLERWIAAARDEGIRALDQLREGVESALTTLGTGFLRHPDNAALRAQVDAGDLDPRDLYRYLLRLVYRLLFLFVAEDRDLLLLPDADPAVRDRYDRYYSTGRLRELASLPTGSGHDDLWAALTSLMHVLERDEGEPALGLPGLGSFLWAHDSIGSLVESSLDNEDLLDAHQGLAYVDEGGALRRIDFAGMGAEELGSVYESLLELHPSFGDDRNFVLGGGAGSERKTTGSYYTPTELIVELLDSALDPVLEEAASSVDPEKAILDLKIVDPAVGSGHFLVAAAHRVAKRLAEVRTGEPEPPEADYRHAVRDVVSRCLFAVDVNDLAVELCKVSLWLEALEPGKPLSFLDHHILVGNSLFGATPAAIADGIPDDAFKVLTGDDKKTVSELKKRNRKERSGQDGLPFDAADSLTSLGSEMQTLEDFDDEDLETVRAKERMLADWKTSPAYKQAKLVADTWCAAFAIEKAPGASPLTDSVFRRVRDEGRIPENLQERVDRLAQKYSFFHWHLAFPQVFRTSTSGEDTSGWSGGFDVVLGNPPWERVKLSDKEYFAELRPDIARAGRAAARRSMISQLASDDPQLFADYQQALRQHEAMAAFLQGSSLYPLGSGGDVNTYAVFAELASRIVDSVGSCGMVVPTGIATDKPTEPLIAEWVRSRRLASLFDFENRKGIFPGVHRSMRFCLLSIRGSLHPVDSAVFVFFAHHPSDIRATEKRFRLTADQLALLKPVTKTLPTFRATTDAALTLKMFDAGEWIAAGDGEGPFNVRFRQGLYNFNSDSELLKPRSELGAPVTEEGNWLTADGQSFAPVYEFKMFTQYDHRAGHVRVNPGAALRQSYVEELSDTDHQNPRLLATPKYWSRADELERRMAPLTTRKWAVGWGDVTSATNWRTTVAAILPLACYDLTIRLAFIQSEDARLAAFFCALLNSFSFDYVARQMVGGTHLSEHIMAQLPCIPPAASLMDLSWTADRVLELSYTAVDLGSFAEDLNRAGAPFRWSRERRPLMQAELDAAFAHMFKLETEELEHVLDSFPIVERQDISEHGSYRTKELILDVYDRMARAIETGEPYQTILDPPPADPSLRVDVDTAT